jgi:DNA-binding PadR family transcriptional regulator
VPRARGERLLIGEWAVLGILACGPAHGFAIGRRLAPSGDVGRIWSLSRPLAYRALDVLQSRRLIEPLRSEAGGGPHRTILTLTDEGRRRLDEWLCRPVEHVRDLRSELLLKLVVCDLNGVDPRPLLRAQKEALGPVFAALLDGDDATLAADPVRVWREESARAAARFLDRMLAAHESDTTA